jgi:hypothetical protein
MCFAAATLSPAAQDFCREVDENARQEPRKTLPAALLIFPARPQQQLRKPELLVFPSNPC